MRRGWLLSCLMLLVGQGVEAQTSYPMITHTTPVAVQRGQTTEVTVEGRMSFFGAYKVFFDGPGIQAEVLGDKPASRPATGAVPNVTRVKLKVTVAPDAPLGVRELRVATALGLSSIGQLLVADAPVVEEKAVNNTQAQAFAIPVPGVVSGRIEVAEDVDWYKLRAAAGQTFSFEVLCARIEDKIHDLQKHADPLIAVYDGAGRELAASDDFFFADPQITHTFKEAGEYFVQVRDSKYDGDPRWLYALLVTDRPAVTHVYPMAGRPGQTVAVEPVGSARLAQEKIAFQAPAQAGTHRVTLPVGGQHTNPVTFLVDDRPQVLEAEPNDAPEKATPVTLPCGINGRIGEQRDLDHFAFAAKKGQPLRFEVFARRFGTDLVSSLDSSLDILNAKGAVVASNDDVTGKDSLLSWTAPADGTYILRIRDLNSKGGPTFVYYIACGPAVPDFTVRCDSDKAMIGPGTSTTWFVHVARQNGFAGPVEVQVDGLPAGVKVNPLTIPPTMTQGILVVTAAKDAKVDASAVRIVGKAKATVDGKEEELVRPATPNQEIYFPGGGRGTFDVNMQTAAVTETSDIMLVKVTPGQEIKLKPGQEVRLEVEIQRRPDYDKAVSLDVMLRHLGRVFGSPLPPGVTLVEGKSKTLLGTASKGHIVLKAAPDAAPIDRVPISVLAHVSINFVVKVSYSSEPIWLSVVK